MDESIQKKTAREGYYKWHADRAAGARRNAGIVALRQSGATLVECGRKFGVSRTRVKQLVDKANRKAQP